MAEEEAGTLHFRKMLAKLAHVLGHRELESMKYLCMDKIPRAILEDINSPVQLWVALEERAVITEFDTTFLEMLLRHACAGRQDVLDILNTYKNEVDGLILKKEDLTKEFDVISISVGNKWRDVARKLGLSEMEIDLITEKYGHDLREQIRQSLLLWQRKNREKATKKQLIEVLQSAQFRMLAHKIKTDIN